MLAAPYARPHYGSGVLAPLGAVTVPTHEPMLFTEIEFASGGWFDVSEYLSAATIKRGKQRSLDKVAPGTMVLTLRNADRRFDPEYAAGPYFGDLLPGKGIRLRAHWDGTNYTLLTGFVDRIVQEYDPPNDAVAVLDCSDGLAKLAATKLGSPWAIDVEGMTPYTWLRLGEHAGPYAFDSSGNRHHAAYGEIGGTITYGAAGLLAEDSDGAVSIAVGSSFILLPPSVFPTTASWTMSFLLNMAAPPPPASTQYLLFPHLVTPGLRVYMNELGKIAVEVTKPDGTQGAILGTNVNFASGDNYLITVVASTGQKLKLYVDDLDFTSTNTGTAHTITAANHLMGFSDQVATSLDEVMFFDRALSLAEIQDLVFAKSAWSGDSGNDRITRILDEAGWPALLRDITTEFDDTLRPTPLSTSTLAHLQDLETTIEGRLWVEPDGTLRLLGRNDHLTEPYSESQATFGDGPGELGYTQMGGMTLSLDLVTNAVRRVNGESVVQVSDAASITAYGKRDETDVAEANSEYLTLSYEDTLAAFRLAHFAEPVAYIEGLQIMPRGDPAGLWPHVLGRDLSDRITFVRRPQGVGDPISMETIVEGITHTIGPRKWVTEFSIDAIAAQRYFLFDVTEWDSEDWRFAA